jgi:hypothetical protein
MWTVGDGSASVTQPSFSVNMTWSMPGQIAGSGGQGSIAVMTTGGVAQRICVLQAYTSFTIQGGGDSCAQTSASMASASASPNLLPKGAADGTIGYVWVSLGDGGNLYYSYQASTPQPVVTVPPGTGGTARVAQLSGEVTVRHADGSVEPVTAATVLGRGDQLETGVDSQVVLSFKDGSRMQVREMTQLLVADLLNKGSRQNVTVQLKLGEVSAQVNPKKEFQTDFKLTTPTGHTASRGTVFSVFYDPVAKATIVRTLVHKVAFTPRRRGSKTIIVPAGKEIEATRSGVSRLAPIGKAGARGGIDIEKARDLALAFVDRFASACSLTSHAGAGVKPAGAAAWTVTIPLLGRATGTSAWRVAGSRVTPINALAKRIAAGCH